MLQLPSDFILYGFTYVDDLSKISLNRIEEKIVNEDLKLKKLIISAWMDVSSDCTWIVVGNKYLNEDEIMNIIDYILENNYDDEYGFNLN